MPKLRPIWQWCPHCCAQSVSQANGIQTCARGHTYPDKDACFARPGLPTLIDGCPHPVFYFWAGRLSHYGRKGLRAPEMWHAYKAWPRPKEDGRRLTLCGFDSMWQTLVTAKEDRALQGLVCEPCRKKMMAAYLLQQP